MVESAIVRCEWVERYPELTEYHDTIWGRPTRDDQQIFAAYGQCILHAGLLWTAMLKKRAIFAVAFDDWDVELISQYDGADIDRLVHTEGMIRNFQKINAIINNARRVLEVRQEFPTFADYIWRFEGKDGRRVAGNLSDDLRRRKFKFAGPTTAYGLMQDIGMVNDHDKQCFFAQKSF